LQAIVCTRYGSPDVLQLREMQKPSPKANEILVKVYAASVTAADGMMREGSPYFGRLFIGLLKPKSPIPGAGFAGKVAAVGAEVTRFKKGDPVFGESIAGFGAYAEFLCVPEDGIIATTPRSMTFEQAAALCDGALTSINFLKNVAKIQRGQSVLINGASGSLGTAAVQLAGHFGAKVTGVCGAAHVEMVKSLGADEVIDYSKKDFTKTGRTYDIIYDTVGKSSFSRCKDSLSEKGVYVSPVLGLPLLLQMLWTSRIGNKKARFSATGLLPVAELLILLKELVALVEAEKINSVMDKSYPLELTAEAHRYVDKGHKKGNVVITMHPDSKT